MTAAYLLFVGLAAFCVTNVAGATGGKFKTVVVIFNILTANLHLAQSGQTRHAGGLAYNLETEGVISNFNT